MVWRFFSLVLLLPRMLTQFFILVCVCVCVCVSLVSVWIVSAAFWSNEVWSLSIGLNGCSPSVFSGCMHGGVCSPTYPVHQSKPSSSTNPYALPYVIDTTFVQE